MDAIFRNIDTFKSTPRHNIFPRYNYDVSLLNLGVKSDIYNTVTRGQRYMDNVGSNLKSCAYIADEKPSRYKLTDKVPAIIPNLDTDHYSTNEADTIVGKETIEKTCINSNIVNKISKDSVSEAIEKPIEKIDQPIVKQPYLTNENCAVIVEHPIVQLKRKCKTMFDCNAFKKCKK